MKKMDKATTAIDEEEMEVVLKNDQEVTASEEENNDNDDDDLFGDSTEIDFDYEYDAPKFYDFCRPESKSADEQTDKWFRSAGNYPPSPFILKLKWKIEPSLVVQPNSTSSSKTTSDESESLRSTLHDPDVSMASQSSRSSLEQRKSKPKSSLKPNSNLMRPTLSQLAKQNQPISLRSFGRQQQHGCLLTKTVEINATKRQKLDSGYLRKVSHLKHQTPFAHKSPKKTRNSSLSQASSRSRVTIPKEPDLETSQRAQRRSSVRTSKPDETSKVKHEPYKARPLNKKIFETPSVPPPKKRTPCVTEFKEFNFRTSQRFHCSATKVAAAEETLTTQSSRRVKPGNALKQDKNDRLKACPVNKKILASKGETRVLKTTKGDQIMKSKEYKLCNDDISLQNLPTELFSKMSLKSEDQIDTENQGAVPPPAKMKHLCSVKHSSCKTGRRLMAISNYPIFNRSVQIH